MTQQAVLSNKDGALFEIFIVLKRYYLLEEDSYRFEAHFPDHIAPKRIPNRDLTGFNAAGFAPSIFKIIHTSLDE